jgi:hypothetical protein
LSNGCYAGQPGSGGGSAAGQDAYCLNLGEVVDLKWLTSPYNIFEPDQVEMCHQVFRNLFGASATVTQARRPMATVAGNLRPA